MRERVCACVYMCVRHSLCQVSAAAHVLLQACERMISLGAYLFLCGGTKWNGEHARLVTMLACDPSLEQLDRKVASTLTAADIADVIAAGATNGSAAPSVPATAGADNTTTDVAVGSSIGTPSALVSSAAVAQTRVELQDAIVAYVLQVCHCVRASAECLVLSVTPSPCS